MRRFLLYFIMLLLPAGSLSASPGSAVCRLSPDRSRRFFLKSVRAVEDERRQFQGVRVDGRALFFDPAARSLTCEGRTRDLSDLDCFSAPFPELGLLVFDLEQPFLSWGAAVYDGPGDFLGRPVQRFSIGSPDPGRLSRVYVWIDGRFGLPLGWDAFDSSGRLWRQFRVRSFRRCTDGWAVGRMQIRDLESGRTISLERL